MIICQLVVHLLVIVENNKRFTVRELKQNSINLLFLEQVGRDKYYSDFTHNPASRSIVRSELHEPHYNVKAVMNKNNTDIYSSVTDLDYQLP